MSTAIQWTDETWNPITGCAKVSPGCANCYIERTPAFRMTGQRFERGRIPVRLHHDRLDQPLRWRKPRRVFVVSMGDLFHEDVPDEFICSVFAHMDVARHRGHTFQILTKRPERMRRLLADADFAEMVAYVSSEENVFTEYEGWESIEWAWPLPNVWLGVSVENQRMADERIPLLLETPAAVRFLSCEPLLGPLDLRPWLPWSCSGCGFPVDRLSKLANMDSSYLAGHVEGGSIPDVCGPLKPDTSVKGIDWVIVGGESGPGRAERKLVERCMNYQHPRISEAEMTAGPHRRDCSGWRPKPHALEWLRSIRDQCQAAGVPFFFKQWGGPTPKAGGRLLDGREWNEMPQRETVPA